MAASRRIAAEVLTADELKPVSGRRPLQARAVRTRARLVEAAAAILLERGYDGLTTTEVSARAGVSRGAQLHHFPNRASLVAATVEHLLATRLEAFRARFELLGGPVDLEELLASLWAAFADATFVAWAELWVAARTDPQLAERMIEMDLRFTEESRALFASLVSHERVVDPATAELVRDVLFAAFVGLGFQRMLPRSRREVGDYLHVLARLARTELGATGARA